MAEKLSPYGFDVGRIGTLIARPNIRLSTLRRPSAPNDSVFPDSGLIHLPGAVNRELCDSAVQQHADFEALMDRTGCAVRAPDGRNFRLANFHLKSEALLKIGLQDSFHSPISAFFRRRSTIYTSLFYKFGSQQKAHSDTPFFWTRPFNLFVGLWVALEDIRDDAGPLFYSPGSHKLFDSEDELRTLYVKARGDVQVMFDLMRDIAEKTIAPVRVLIKKGDAVIWHPGILHGGTPASDPTATRYSMVYHFAPLGVNVRHDKFPNEFANVPTYGTRMKDGNYYCRVSLPASMIG